MTLLSRVAAVLVALLGAVLIAPSPAQAEYRLCGALAGSYTNNSLIYLCTEDSWAPVGGNDTDGFWLSSTVMIGGNATSATNCVVTLWAELDKAGASPWESKSYPINCKAALTHRNTDYDYNHVIGPTSGTHINTHGCINLYFNGSTTAGWHRCSSTGWHKLEL